MTYNNTVTAAPGAGQIIWQASLLLALLLFLSACVSLQPRRDDPAPCSMGTSCDQSMIEHADGYQLGYVQFDDEGLYAQAGQLERVTNDIEAATTHGLILVGFTHGWKQNSDADGWSVNAFKDMLAAISTREQQLAATQLREPRLVAGVFMGWPGHTSMLPGFSGLSWFNREDAAERIARGDYGDALLRLKQVRDVSIERGAKSQLILVGHSLGATMLYQRIVQEPLRNRGAIRTPIADLVLLLSPAIPAAAVIALETLSPADGTALPPIMAITSEGDGTLRMAFPLAQWLDNPSQTSGHPARMQAMGVYAPLITHRLEVANDGFSLVPTGMGIESSALLQVSASQSVMQGHKDIANPRLVDFIADVTELQIDNRLSRAGLAQAFAAAPRVH